MVDQQSTTQTGLLEALTALAPTASIAGLRKAIASLLVTDGDDIVAPQPLPQPQPQFFVNDDDDKEAADEPQKTRPKNDQRGKWKRNHPPIDQVLAQYPETLKVLNKTLNNNGGRCTCGWMRSQMNRLSIPPFNGVDPELERKFIGRHFSRSRHRFMPQCTGSKITDETEIWTREAWAAQFNLPFDAEPNQTAK